MSNTTKQQYEWTVHNKRETDYGLRDCGLSPPRLNAVASLCVECWQADAESESPIESRTREWLAARLSTDVVMRQQVWFAVGGDRFRVDFYLERNDYRIIVEADGKQYHAGERNRQRDERRDWMLIGAGGVNEVWRIPGGAITRNVSAALARLVLTHREWFDLQLVADDWSHGGVTASPDFAPVTDTGWFDTPTPKRGRTIFRAQLRKGWSR